MDHHDSGFYDYSRVGDHPNHHSHDFCMLLRPNTNRIHKTPAKFGFLENPTQFILQKDQGIRWRRGRRRNKRTIISNQKNVLRPMWMFLSVIMCTTQKPRRLLPVFHHFPAHFIDCSTICRPLILRGPRIHLPPSLRHTEARLANQKINE